jgi:hypothetical protein
MVVYFSEHELYLHFVIPDHESITKTIPFAATIPKLRTLDIGFSSKFERPPLLILLAGISRGEGGHASPWPSKCYNIDMG